MANSLLNRRDFVKMIGAGAVSLVVPPSMNSTERQIADSEVDKKLNFVFILIDDMGWVDAGCYSSIFYETANINKLASEGMRFTDGYATCPVCSPTRASIMTGKYPARLNLTNYLTGKHRGKLNPAKYVPQLALEEVTIAESFKEAGYTTCFIGKWHLGDQPYYPEHQGFDINHGGWHRGAPSYDCSPTKGGYFTPYKNPKLEDGPDGEYLTDRLTEESLKFIDANKDKPFLLYLSHYGVHFPLQAKAELVAKYSVKAKNQLPAERLRFGVEGGWKIRQVQDHPVFAAMVQSVDESVGRVMKKLAELGLSDNTAVIFTSDNGGCSTAEDLPTSNVPLRAGKGWLYEGGIRVPMIIKWPKVVKAGSICSEPVTSTDFYPTMLKMAGLSPKPKQHIDGINLVPLLKGTESLDRKAIFWHYPHYNIQKGTPSGAVRVGYYKLIEFYEDNHVELYDLEADISEKNNLAKKMPVKAAELSKMLQDWREDVDAQMPTPNPDYNPGKDTFIYR